MLRHCAVLLLGIIALSISVCSVAQSEDDCDIYNTVILSDWRFQAKRCNATTVYVPDETIDISAAWEMSSDSPEKKYADYSHSVKSKEEEILLKQFIAENSTSAKLTCNLQIQPKHELLPRLSALQYLTQHCKLGPPDLPPNAIGFIFVSKIAYNADHSKAVLSWGYMLCDDCMAMSRIVLVKKDNTGWHLEKFLLEQVC